MVITREDYFSEALVLNFKVHVAYTIRTSTIHHLKYNIMVSCTPLTENSEAQNLNKNTNSFVLIAYELQLFCYYVHKF